MARTLSIELSNAINNPAGIRAGVRLTVYKGKNYFDSFTSSNCAPSYFANPGISSTPLSESISYDTSGSKLYSVFINPINGNLELMKSGSDVVVTLAYSGTIQTSLIRNGISFVYPYIYYVMSNFLCKATLNTTMLSGSYPTSSGSLNCISAKDYVDYFSLGITANVAGISGSNVVMAYIDDGGVGLKDYYFSSGSWTTNAYPNRIMNPGAVYPDLSNDSGYMLRYFTAVSRTDGIWIYYSMPTGEIKGIHINNDLTWSDQFIAVQKDLSVLKISNAIVDTNERIHLCGQFQRVDDFDAFSSDSVWNMLLSSDSGKVFSLERNKLFSMTGYRFFVAKDNADNLYYSTCNRYILLKAPYDMVYENTDSLVINDEAISLQGSPDGGYTVVLSTPSEALIDHSLFVEENYIKLEVGINTSGSSLTYTTIDTCVIAAINTGIANSKRSVSLNIISAGVYKLNQFSYPFYLEMQGKQALMDQIKDMSNMYRAGEQPGMDTLFSTDFWGTLTNYRGGGLAPLVHAPNVDKVFKSADLKDYNILTDYPEISTSSITIKIYGWSRAGRLYDFRDWYNTVGAGHPAATSLNDTFTPRLTIIKASSGSEITYTVPSGSLTSAYNYPAKTWYPSTLTRPVGSYPVIYTVVTTGSAGIEVGDKIKLIEILCSSTGSAVSYIERVEIPEVHMYIDSSVQVDDTEQVSKNLWDYDISDGQFYSGVKKGLLIDNVGIPNVYFSTRPYCAFNFEAEASIKISGSYTYGGLVGIGADGKNFICGRYKNGGLQIVKYRYGVPTILASTSFAPSGSYIRLYFMHRDGDFYLGAMNNNTDKKITKKLHYKWTYADGAIATDPDLMHIGTFSMIDPPKFRITSFDPAKSSIISMLPGYDIDEFRSFPSSGSVTIDGVDYSYGSKSITQTGSPIANFVPQGPFQARNIAHSSYKNFDYEPGDPDSENFRFEDWYVEFNKFEWISNSGPYFTTSGSIPNYNKYKNFIIATNCNYAWKLVGHTHIDHPCTDFKPYNKTKPIGETNKKKIPLLNKVRCFTGGSHPGKYMRDVDIGGEDKAFITVGLMDVEKLTEDKALTHIEGAFCYKYCDSKVKMTDFFAASADHDSTVKDLLSSICALTGVTPVFPGDETISSQNVTDGVWSSLL